MPDDASSDHLRRMALIYGTPYDALNEALDRSSDPRGPEMLLELAGAYIRPGGRVLDVGCRDARHLIELVRRYDCLGAGFDPVDRNVERAEAAVAEAGLDERVQITKGIMERIDHPDRHFDFVWCRDVLELVEGLDRGLSEAARVLKPDGRMLIYTNFATELLGRKEAERLHRPLGSVLANFDEDAVESAFDRAGLAVERREVIGTEWREYEEERDRRASRDLLRLARLRRRREEIVREHGQERFEVAEASLQWRTYQFLGKLEPRVYVLRRA